MTTPITPDESAHGSVRHPDAVEPGTSQPGAAQPDALQPGKPHTENATRKGSPSTRVIVAVTAAVGGVALLAVAASTAYSDIMPERYDAIDAFVGSATDLDETDGSGGAAPGSEQVVDDGSGTVTHFAPVDAVRALDVEISGASFEVAFGDVAEAELVATGDRAANWTLAVREGRLTVETPDRGFTTGCFVNCGAGSLGDASGMLTLPQSMIEDGRLDAELSVEGGALRGSGSFRSLDVSVQGGDVRLDGSAQNLEVEVEAGKAELELADVGTAEVGVEAGSVRVAMTGAAPDRVSVEASTGSAALDLPEADYRVDATAELGEFDDRLAKSDDSKHVVSVRAEAAKVVLQ
ncbi:DUF4097 family beta strand repeat-containing protein [Leucobacter chromiiresistens]|uniref:Putative adhesin n=1 Tax=Leucobacter chromiiresistens TaxID=1079994 RepID=A0A1H0Y908_9MICO|nr:DUF4097 family beta strand repeat-containing protein [Leucobacter chromiiresistens]SDQ11602.1 Putative adhesin [Leucobacter chromiiresistens]